MDVYSINGCILYKWMYTREGERDVVISYLLYIQMHTHILIHRYIYIQIHIPIYRYTYLYIASLQLLKRRGYLVPLVYTDAHTCM